MGTSSAITAQRHDEIFTKDEVTSAAESRARTGGVIPVRMFSSWNWGYQTLGEDKEEGAHKIQDCRK